MRSSSAVALFTLAIITECFGAQSDRSRSRSGPVRSVPVAADIKRDVDFDCPEEFGYYPHPTDCTLYYVCVFGGALLESCTGGLMYSHELQTCDWPRNVGCDGTSAVGGEELERINERDPPPPPPPPPRRTPPPPPPRAQPNPVVTSRGQPKFSRQEYEKQQQLYAEVDDLPPVEEIESDRQQRVYRGQPATIGQVQKDRDGYAAQPINTGRNLNSNIIPASIPQNSGKIGSFSFGSQVDERRTATVTPAPQSYSEDKSDSVTDSSNDRQLDVETNEIITNDLTEKPVLRKKREVVGKDLTVNETSSSTTKPEEMSKRSDSGEEMEYFEIDTDIDDGASLDETERGKRQIRYYYKDGYKAPGKNWALVKPAKIVQYHQPQHNPNVHSARYQQSYNNNLNNNNYYDTRRPQYNNNVYSTANPFLAYQSGNSQSQIVFKPSLPDPSSQPHNPLNSATQIITKSPPISSLNNDPFTALAGGFYNNAQPAQGNVQYIAQIYSTPSSANHQHNPISFPDSVHDPSTIVTGKPVPVPTSPRPQEHYRNKEQERNKYQQQNQHLTQNNQQPTRNVKVLPPHAGKRPSDDKDYDDEGNSNEDEDESSEEDEEEDDDDHDFAPPREFTYPSYKYKEIENPFANPNFDFDAYLTKISNGQYSPNANTKPRPPTVNKQNIEVTTISQLGSRGPSSPLNYEGMSTPKPFTVPTGSSIVVSSVRPSAAPIKQAQSYDQVIQRPEPANQNQQIQQQQSFRPNAYVQQTAGTPLEANRPKLKPPNFNDDRQLPISYSFSRPISSTPKPNQDTKTKGENQHSYSVTAKPYLLIAGTGAPILVSTPKHQYLVKPEKIVALHPQIVATAKPYLVSSIKPHNAHIILKQSTPKPLTTLALEQLSALQQYWKNPSTESIPFHSVSYKPSTPKNIQNLENLFAQAIKSTQMPPVKNYSNHQNAAYTNKSPITTTTKAPPKRRPIPKPSPEMNDYYYDDDEEQYYYEPAVKPKYMPSTEVKPQRPPMAQNYKEYEDSYEDDDVSVNVKPKPTRVPIKYKPESATKNHNDVSIVTKAPLKDFTKNINGKIPIPVLVDYGSPTPNTLIRPEISNYQIIHHMPRNRTVMHIRRPVTQNGPNTVRPPKYLNQTTLRPYTVRHRLAKPTTLTENSQEDKTRGRIRHPNIVAQMKLTTPHDSHNQETRFTKTKHDDKTNSLEPTESVAPVSYSASPRPKMLYNGSQNYSPDQYDPFYAVYDEDGELYKDTDYVQQYNTASLRPAVQQTYRGTPPPAPARRPVETYTPRPSPVDYDDELIQPQINNQNQYQAPIRHSTRGEGNELGYDHNPSSVRTTLYEATTLSTTPPTTSTSTTTQRPTTAPYTEAMTPSRYSPRSSTDESPIPESSSKPSDETSSSAPTTSAPIINFSSLAKPFEKTDNVYRLKETISTTETHPTSSRRSSEVTNNSNNVEVVRSKSSRNNKKVSLTSGFSIRRNPNNANNPYTLTVLTRPLEDFDKARKPNSQEGSSSNSRQRLPDRYYEDKSSDSEDVSEEPIVESDSKYVSSSESSMRRNDYGPDNSEDEYDIPVYVRPTSRPKVVKSRIRTTTTPSTTTTKYYIKSANTRPTPFVAKNQEIVDSTENSINTEALIETGLRNAHAIELSTVPLNNTLNEQLPTKEYDRSEYTWNEPTVSPFKTLDNLRNSYRTSDTRDYTTSTTSTTVATTTTRRHIRNRNNKKQKIARKPSYYSYRLEDEVVPDQTTEIFNGKVKTVIKAFLNNFVSSTEPLQVVEDFSTTTSTTTVKPTTPSQRNEDEVVNIGFQKKPFKYVDEKPLRSNVKRLQIITEAPVSRYVTPSAESISFTEEEREMKDFSSTTTTMATMSSTPFTYANVPTSPMPIQSSTNDFRNIPSRDSYQSKFSSFITSKPENEASFKFKNIINDAPSTESSNRDSELNDEVIEPTQSLVEDKATTETEVRHNNVESEIASTTSTTKSTTTLKFEPTTSTTKSISFPPRASRVNPAIKLAATNPGGGRRSYQSSSKCSSDNSLQANPKCNEIKYQRPTSTRGRGSAHYSTASDSQSPQPAPNRGTPPTRSRPTLKPSTAIVSKSTEFVDIYAHPPSRPDPVYPQPTPDKTAAKCRKDVCLLPDCYCGGKEIPGNLPVHEVPQIVLITFDDAVNDLNKMYYEEIFERGRKNPNGCPITGTFYVSHEWTDYSQVQNLYADGHEFGSHTVSHSFGEQFSQKKWYREVGGQREILAAYGGVKLEDVRGMRAPFLSVGGNKMFKMLYDANFTYDSSLPVYENRPPSWPYTLDYKLFHDCMIPPCPTKSYPGVWEVPMVMWQDLNGGRCSMGDACANPPEAENVYKMILKNFDRHYTTNRAPFGLYYHAAWFTQPHHKEGFIMFLDFINQMKDVWIVTNWQALQWVRDPTPISRLNNFQPFQCNYQDRPKKCNNPKVCNLWHKSGVRYMRTCQPCPEVYPWTGKSGIRSSRIDNDIGE
ncbi:mucin-5AC isoform X2 [Spodoptera frugiperda]|uniref:Mucin-5AC isoform X2 n=1 Tax=Spodoptera frugiperda TaxID=7108 RepID=A0A9R0DXK5_SPOFR|nr:mucin-5AC isoform X2 [Spodoptera frugiperda]